MASLWPWLVIAGAGALHGLNPAGGWMFAAAWSVHARSRTQALWALLPIALGHLATIALVAAAAMLGLGLDRIVLQVLAGGLLVAIAAIHLSHRGRRRIHAPAGHAGLALWSFMVTTAHGAGLMLVPALVPLCLGELPGREANAARMVALALAAIGVHLAAMLAVTALMALGARRGFDALVQRSCVRANGVCWWKAIFQPPSVKT